MIVNENGRGNAPVKPAPAPTKKKASKGADQK